MENNETDGTDENAVATKLQYYAEIVDALTTLAIRTLGLAGVLSIFWVLSELVQRADKILG